jgi:CTP synthase
MPRFIFVVGGVMSGVGKGVATASLGRILKSKGFKVTAIKIDPYINVDAGTMNPIEHGEVFVMDDGTECDQDIGNYERFLDETLNTDNYLTTGRVYQTVINRERNLEYGGRCVEVVPDIPNEIIYRIKKAGRKNKADFILIEVGGTVGEYQNMLFLEAGRMMKLKNPKEVIFILVSYLPIPATIGEMKTKPTQTAARILNGAGIQADIILGRAKVPLDEPRKRKISIFCSVQKEDVISAPNIESIYEVPLIYEKENLGNRVLKKFGLESKKKDLRDWRKLVKRIKNAKKEVKIGIVGKYFKTGDFTLMDSYISVIEAIKHAVYSFGRKPKISWLSAEKYQRNPDSSKELKNYDGIIIPGGFGKRGIEGKIRVIEFLRKNKIPFLGLCLGMQLSVVEFARNVCGMKEANSTEFSKTTKYPVIDVMPEQKALLREKKYGATMRLGAYNCKLKEGTVSFRAYGKERYVSERHRHRYELNNVFLKRLEKKGLVIAGVNPEKNLVEIIEIKNHPFFVATQFHPEFKSSPLKPHPLFLNFIRASIKKRT